MGLSSSADPAVCWRAGFAVPGSQEGVSLKGPLQSQVPMWLSPRPGQSSQQCFCVHPVLRSLPSGWAFPNALQLEARATLPSVTQCCATFKPGPGTSRPLPKAPQQSRTVLWTGLPATLRVRPMCKSEASSSVPWSLGRCLRPSLVSLSVWVER